MFASHLTNFLELACKHPDAYWYSDNLFKFNKLDGVKGISEEAPTPRNGVVKNVPEGLTGICQGNGYDVIVRHPIRGGLRIETYADAMDMRQRKCVQRAVKVTLLL